MAAAAMGETLKAAVRAQAPGTGTTRIPFSRAAETRRYPGSEILGVPASVVSATLAPFSRSSMSPLADFFFVVFVVAQDFGRRNIQMPKQFLKIRECLPRRCNRLFENFHRAKCDVFGVSDR